jgi:hypothetical protein
MIDGVHGECLFGGKSHGHCFSENSNPAESGKTRQGLTRYFDTTSVLLR